MAIEYKFMQFKYADPHAEKAEDEAVEVDSDVIMTLSGYAATYEDPDNPDAWGDIIDPGAFDDWIEADSKNDHPLAMKDSHGKPVGAWTGVENDPDGNKDGKSGLWVDGEVYEAYTGPDMATMVRKNVIRGLSVGIRVKEYSFLEDYKDRWGWPVRKILKADLYEVSPTTSPANTEAEIMAWKSSLISSHQQKTIKVDLTPGIKALDALLK